ncbi:hypothetical protein BJX63DRAFT_392471 [Aspergillus granulosus]|uniref:Azaphilone pigments biosynthesis cluster protein L N-terminal domain-containing protein n=1 Tax=Aspergillus granulosus TaxID=176169 RepID=A0ABR4HGM7_9EURO
MADPVSIAASVLAIITATIQSTNALHETVKRYRERNRTLGKLQDELEDLLKILASLQNAVEADAQVLELLEGPVQRCGRLCREFEDSMKVFSGNSKPGFRDWARMEFMKGNINDFIETIATYKSTISVGLGTITMHRSKVSHKVLEEYNEMIKDTTYNLQVYLQRIDEKLAKFTAENTDDSRGSIDLEDERAVTEQCLHICEDAKSYVESLTRRESNLLQDVSHTSADEATMQKHFEAQRLTREALDGSQKNLADIINHMQKRLQVLVTNDDPAERSRLQEDIQMSKQCLEVCQVASNVSRQKIFQVGEVVAEGDSDQVVVTTLADLFDVRKASSIGNSAQLVGSMTTQELQQLVEKRYSSRFGAYEGALEPARSRTSNKQSVDETKKSTHTLWPTAGFEEHSSGPSTKPNIPSSNETRKRVMGGVTN